MVAKRRFRDLEQEKESIIQEKRRLSQAAGEDVAQTVLAEDVAIGWRFNNG